MSEQEEIDTQAWQRPLREIEASCARRDWDAAERATKELMDTFAALEQHGIDRLELQGAAADAIARAASLAVTDRKLHVAAHLLRAGGEWLCNDAAAALALADSDVELCAANIILHASGFEGGRRALWHALGEQCAGALLEVKSRDRALLAAEVIRAAITDQSSMEAGDAAREEADAWLDSRRIPRDPTSGSEAVVRLCARRRGGEHAEVFEACAATHGLAVRETPELLGEAARCALLSLDRGSRSSIDVTTYALHAILHGREEEARARVDALIAAQRRPARRKLIEGGWEWAQELAAGIRGDNDVPGQAFLESEDGFTRVLLGEFTVTSSTLIASDPCYDGIDSRIQVLLRNARTGRWTATALRVELSSGTHTGVLIASHADHPCSPCDEIWKEASSLGVGVDSGQAGIFEVCHYRDEAVAPPAEDAESAWYEMCCATARGGGGVIPHGCVVTSGYGDGLYSCLIARSEGRIVGVALAFGVLPEEPA